ncbi:MAG: CAP domain-containing protein [Acidobacteriota bacterium]
MRHLILALLVVCAPALMALDFGGDERANEITAENVTALMNAYRADAGLPPLRIDARLTRAAESRMQDMLDGGWWNHRSPDGTSPFVWVSLADYKYSMAAENLANGFETARLLVETWMESPGHRANILGAGYADCGIAIIEGSTRGPATGKSVVVMFGRRMAEVVAAK